MEKEYEVWTEGFAATGQRSDATCHNTKVKAKSFIEACKKVLGDSLDRNEDKTLRLSQNKYPTQDGEINVPMVWACGCFDNEEQARESFG